MDSLLYRLLLVALVGLYGFLIVCLITGDGAAKLASWILDRPVQNPEAFVAGWHLGFVCGGFAAAILIWAVLR